MKKYLLFILSFIAFTFGSKSFAQSNRAFAITGNNQGCVNWTSIREVDLSTGELVRDIYLPATSKSQIYDAQTGKQIVASSLQVQTPFQSLIAAAAYDARTNRLYYTPMQGRELRYIDLNTGAQKIFYVQQTLVSQYKPGEEDNITRMVMASDGYGYALTNNSNHFIRFSTGSNIQITDLGSLKDDVSNGDHSIHREILSWGGDMIADAFGNIYLFVAKGDVFKIETKSLTAKYYGSLKNIPANYLINAAALDARDNVIVSCATDASNYFQVNFTTLEATPLAKKGDKVYNASDFANGNIAYSKDASTKTTVSNNSNLTVSVYPNPVSNRTFTVVLNGSIKEKYSIELTDLSGKNILRNEVSSFAKQQTQKVTLPANIVPETYLLKVITASGNILYTDKIVVQ